MSISAAASSGSRRNLLVAMRDEIASRLDEGVPARDLASLTRRLMEITREIEQLDSAAGSENDPVGTAAAKAPERFRPTVVA